MAGRNCVPKIPSLPKSEGQRTTDSWLLHYLGLMCVLSCDTGSIWHCKGPSLTPPVIKSMGGGSYFETCTVVLWHCVLIRKAFPHLQGKVQSQQQQEQLERLQRDMDTIALENSPAGSGRRELKLGAQKTPLCLLRQSGEQLWGCSRDCCIREA